MVVFLVVKPSDGPFGISVRVFEEVTVWLVDHVELERTVVRKTLPCLIGQARDKLSTAEHVHDLPSVRREGVDGHRILIFEEEPNPHSQLTPGNVQFCELVGIATVPSQPDSYTIGKQLG